MNSDPHRLHHLFGAHSDGTITPEEHAELQECLRSDASARRLWFAHQDIDDGLHDLVHAPAANLVTVAKPTRWLQWRPLAAAAAGIVFGILCTSVVFAYVAPSVGKVITLLQDSFEAGPAPLVTGVPVKAGVWSGDYTEVVGEQQGVKPEAGTMMLRFLRADFEGKPKPETSRMAEIYRLIDMRPYRDQFADGAAVVQFSAGFNAFAFPEGDTYFCRMSLHAYDTQTVAGGSVPVDGRWNGDDLAAARAGRMKLDRDPATWQRMTGDLRLPPNTNFLMVHIMVYHKRGPSPENTFAGHYLDDVRLTMTRWPPPL